MGEGTVTSALTPSPSFPSVLARASGPYFLPISSKQGDSVQRLYDLNICLRLETQSPRNPTSWLKMAHIAPSCSWRQCLEDHRTDAEQFVLSLSLVLLLLGSRIGAQRPPFPFL